MALRLIAALTALAAVATAAPLADIRSASFCAGWSPYGTDYTDAEHRFEFFCSPSSDRRSVTLRVISNGTDNAFTYLMMAAVDASGNALVNGSYKVDSRLRTMTCDDDARRAIKVSDDSITDIIATYQLPAGSQMTADDVNCRFAVAKSLETYYQDKIVDRFGKMVMPNAEAAVPETSEQQVETTTQAEPAVETTPAAVEETTPVAETTTLEPTTEPTPAAEEETTPAAETTTPEQATEPTPAAEEETTPAAETTTPEQATEPTPAAEEETTPAAETTTPEQATEPTPAAEEETTPAAETTTEAEFVDDGEIFNSTLSTNDLATNETVSTPEEPQVEVDPTATGEEFVEPAGDDNTEEFVPVGTVDETDDLKNQFDNEEKTGEENTSTDKDSTVVVTAPEVPEETSEPKNEGDTQSPTDYEVDVFGFKKMILTENEKKINYKGTLTGYWCEAYGNTYVMAPNTGCAMFYQTIMSEDSDEVIPLASFECSSGSVFSTIECVCVSYSSVICPDEGTPEDKTVKVDSSPIESVATNGTDY